MRCCLDAIGGDDGLSALLDVVPASTTAVLWQKINSSRDGISTTWVSSNALCPPTAVLDRDCVVSSRPRPPGYDSVKSEHRG
jgi:hypothetical protein